MGIIYGIDEAFQKVDGAKCEEVLRLYLFKKMIIFGIGSYKCTMRYILDRC